MIVAGMIGLTAGYYFSPVYQASMYDKTEMGLGVADRYFDLRYINQMAAHHQGAIELAQQVATTSKRTEITDLAQMIITSEPKLIATLLTWKNAWYRDPRPAPTPRVVNLGGYDDKLDLRFLNALIAHHQDGIAMAQEARSKSTRSEILNDADAVELFLSQSLETLRQWREAWYGIN